MPIQATPRNKLLGLLADGIQGVNDFARKPFGYDNPPAGLLMDALSVPAVAATVDRLSYGEPLTTGKGFTRKMRPDTVETALALAPAAVKYPKQTAGIVGGLLGVADTGAVNKAATVWHGTPHKFDKFDASKIGTGEGAQAYGHGLYFAEAPEVARGYQTKLGGGSVVDSRGLPVDPTATTADLQRKLRAAGLSWDDAEDAASGWASAIFDGRVGELHPVVQQELQSMGLAPKAGGSLYKVDLPDEHIAKMLDWDKPLSEQPESIKRLAKVKTRDIAAEEALLARARDMGVLASSLPEYAALEKLMDKAGKQSRMTGRDLYDRFGGAATAASKLREAGIPGIRYLDGGSRGAGGGTSNFVVFPGNEGLLTILERNGQAVK